MSCDRGITVVHSSDLPAAKMSSQTRRALSENVINFFQDFHWMAILVAPKRFWHSYVKKQLLTTCNGFTRAVTNQFIIPAGTTNNQSKASICGRLFSQRPLIGCLQGQSAGRPVNLWFLISRLQTLGDGRYVSSFSSVQWREMRSADTATEDWQCEWKEIQVSSTLIPIHHYLEKGAIPRMNSPRRRNIPILATPLGCKMHQEWNGCSDVQFARPPHPKLQRMNYEYAIRHGSKKVARTHFSGAICTTRMRITANIW